MFSRVLRVQRYTFFYPTTTVAYKNLSLIKYTKFGNCGARSENLSAYVLERFTVRRNFDSIWAIKFLSHKGSLLEASDVETDRKLIFFSWLRSLLRLRENLRKYSEFLSPWFYSRHFANLNFSSAWCYSGKIIIPCTRLFDQQDRLNCKIYPKSREKS